MSEKKLIDLLPAQARAWVETAQTWVKELPRSAKIFFVSTALAAALIGSVMTYRSSNPMYAVLYSNLDRDDAATVTAKLKEMKVPYRVEGDGAVIEVPEDRARELRLELAGAGLPRGGSVGFESFDKMRLGATDFEQRVLYRRSLEGELSRTIGTLAAVQSARVHLVMPEKSVFVTRTDPSSASVVLKLRGGRALGSGEVSGIVHLVSTSVAGLSPDRVAVVTTEGTVLHKPRTTGDGEAGDDERASHARSLEATLEERARSMVEKVTGHGHVDVRVTVDLDPARIERVEDHYDPKAAALRSEERSVERTNPSDSTMTGVPGSESNLPTGSARGSAEADGGAPTVAGLGTSRESHTRNFEFDRVTEKRTINGGLLRRLTVAVVVDGTTPSGAPRSKEEVEKIASLVRSAVGYDEKRGDAVTVEAAPFVVPPVEAEPVVPFYMQPKKVVPVLGGTLGLLVLTSVMALFALRKRAKQAEAKALAATEALDQKSLDVEQIAIEILERQAEEKKPVADSLRQLVRERAATDPATAALVVRAWLGAREAAKEDAA